MNLKNRVVPSTGPTSAMQMTGLLTPGDVGIPYPAYVLIGSSMWGLFMGFYYSAAGTLNAGSGLILQVNYPHEALLIKQAGQHFANFIITFGMNIAVLLAFGVVPAWQTVFFPLVILPFFLGTAMVLIISMISVVAVDLNSAINMCMGFLLYLTPIIYSNKVDNVFIREVIQWNPLTYLVCSARDIIIYGRLYETTGFFVAAGISFVLFLFSWRLFYVSENKVIERMV